MFGPSYTHVGDPLRGEQPSGGKERVILRPQKTGFRCLGLQLRDRRATPWSSW